MKELTKKGREMFVSHLEEIEPGVYENPNATKANTKECQEHYDKNAIKILDDDKYHYQCMARKLKESEVFTKEFYSAADIAGGHPKLASHMNVSEVVVYDQYAEMYERLNGEFVKRYEPKANVSYEKKAVTHSNFTPNAEVAICCHILEHLSLKQIRKLLGNLETDKVIIYGPNVKRARNKNWFHFRPADHRTFCTMEAMIKLIEEAGFKFKEGYEYHEDYLIYGDKK